MGDFSVKKNVNDLLPNQIDPRDGVNNNLNAPAMDHFRLIRLVNDLYNAINNGKVIGIQGTSVNSTPPTDAQIFVYNNGTSKWVPVSLSGQLTITNSGVATISGSGIDTTIPERVWWGS